MKELVVITGYDRFIGQTRKPWIGIRTEDFIKRLEALDYKVHEYSFSDFVNRIGLSSDIPVFYSFSQRDNLRQFIKDQITHLALLGYQLFPALELLLCHENKGYQVLVAEKYGLKTPKTWYISSKREIDCLGSSQSGMKDSQISYPIVLKTITGSNGRGVFLLNTKLELIRKIKSLEPSLSIFQKADLLRRRYLRKNKKFPFYPDLDATNDYLYYKDYITPEQPFVLQEFIPGLKCDYRVIILGDKYYAAKRLTKEGDFRASGAKRFVLEKDLPSGLLDHAFKVKQKLKSPFLSLDIGVANDDFYLFEFQALHFGINAIVRAEGYHYLDGDKWLFKKARIPFENLLADALVDWLNSNNSAK